MSDRRRWWAAGAIVVGVSAALMCGSGIAVAETDGSTATGSRQPVAHEAEASPKVSAIKDAIARHGSGPVAAASGFRAHPSVGDGPRPARMSVIRVSTDTAVRAATVKRRAQSRAAVATGADGPDRPLKHIGRQGIKTTSVLASRVVADVAAATPEAVGAMTKPAAIRSAATAIVALRGLAAPVANSPPAKGPNAMVVLNLLAGLGVQRSLPGGLASTSQQAPVRAPEGATSALAAVPVDTGRVTGVQEGHSDLQIPVGTYTYTGKADWYFPTQADGSVQAQGVIWLQHGFLGRKSWYSALARQLALQTNSVVVVPNVPSFPPRACPDCSLNGVPMQQGVADLFLDSNRVALNTSATAAGYQGVLPESFVLTGHSAGGGLATAAGGFYTVGLGPDQDNKLLGVIMFDGVSGNGTFVPALDALGDTPVYQIAAPPQPWNANGQTTADLVSSRPGSFVGVVLANGSHVDSLIGGVPIVDVITQLVVRRSPPGNTAAVYTLAAGWINDFYTPGAGPDNPQYGIYGEPDQYIVMGQTAAIVLGPPPTIDVSQYLGTWYEVGSVKQFFSIGLVNTKAVYGLNPDGSIRVENSGNYFVDNGPSSTIVGNAVSLNAENNKLNVSFLGPATATPPGNYWIVDAAPDYSWAIVSDANGSSGFLLSRTPVVSDELYGELLDRASAKGVNRSITPTRQPGAGMAALVAV